MAEKKILIIGETMLDKTIFVSDVADNTRSNTTYKIKKSDDYTFGGVFLISRYLQHFENIDITVLNISPELTPKIKNDYEIFYEKFITFSKNGGSSKCIDMKGSSDHIHSITRFISDDKEIYFQIEDYYAPKHGCNIPQNKKRYDYPIAEKEELWTNVKNKIDMWIRNNAIYDRRILLMDYDLGFFEKPHGLLSKMEDYLNKSNSSPVIIYSGKDYTKFNGFKNSHIVTYSKDTYGNFIEPKDFLNNVKNLSFCFRSLVLVSARCTCIRVFPLTKKKNIEEPPKVVPTEAWGCDHTKKRHIPRLGHKAIIAAHLAMVLPKDVDNILLNEQWLEYAHECSKEIAGEILTENFIHRDWRKNIKVLKEI